MRKLLLTLTLVLSLAVPASCRATFSFVPNDS